jgi:hypothetical protein
MELTSADLVDLVLGSAREKPVGDGLSLARQTVVIHEGGKPLEVDHRFPTSSSR